LIRKRCAILADGFYEWKKDTNKQPYYITLTSGSTFAFAGLWDTWKSLKGEPYHSCTIITTEACRQIIDIHDRMPIILKPDYVDAWLDTENEEPVSLESILREGHEEDFNIRPVSKYVNSPRNNDEKCIEEVQS